MKLIYLACPYSSSDPIVMRRRVRQATIKTAQLMRQGYNVFSPITHSDPVAEFMPDELRFDHDFWLDRDFQIIRKCDELHVLALEGWKDSYGVGEEIKLANALGIPVLFHKEYPWSWERQPTEEAPHDAAA